MLNRLKGVLDTTKLVILTLGGVRQDNNGMGIREIGRLEAGH